MPVTVQIVDTPSLLRRFILFPHTLYKDNPYWAPNLISDDKKLLTPGRHPFHEHSEVRLFLALEGEKPVGRICAHVNHEHNRYHKDRVGFFGFFDCIDSPEAASALFEHATRFVASHKMETLRGPMNFSTNETCGLLVNSFDEMPYIMMPYNPPYYEKLILGAGFSKSRDLVCYRLDEELFSFERIGKLVEKIRKRSHVTLREVDFKNLEKEVQIIREIYNAAWSNNWGFVPMTDAEFDHMAKEMKAIVDPRLLLIAMKNGENVGFILCLPDANIVLKKMNGRLFPLGILKALWYKRKINRIRIITMGVKEEYRGAGIDLLFYHKIATTSPSIGYPTGELGWVLEDNRLMNRAAKQMGAHITKRYRIFDRPVIFAGSETS